MNLDLGVVYVPTEDGQYVNEVHARIAEIIHDYDPELELAWIPPDKRGPKDSAFAVIHRPMGHPTYIAFYVDEWECDERVLARIFKGDVRNHGGTILSDIDANNAAIKALTLHKSAEMMEEAHAKAQFVLKSSKDTIDIDGVRIHSTKPSERLNQRKVL